MRGEGGPVGPPSFPGSRVARPVPSGRGRRPVVPMGLESARQLMAAAPISREG